MTATHNGVTGENYYAKPSPVAAGAWDADDIALTVNPNLSSQFTFTNDPEVAYDIYRRAGASPANTDEIVATVSVSAQAAAAAAITAFGPLKPTVTGRTLDVTATGTAGIDWGNVENKNTFNDLEGTTIAAITNPALGMLLKSLAIEELEVVATTATTAKCYYGLVEPTIDFASFVGSAVFVKADSATQLSGSAGQPRIITAADYVDEEYCEITIDKPWDLQPEESSYLLVLPFANRSEPLTNVQTQAAAAAAIDEAGLATAEEVDEAKDEVLEAIGDIETTSVIAVTIPAIEAESIVLGVEVTRYRGTKWQIAVEGLGTLPTKCYATVKRGSEPDASAIAQVVVTDPAAGTDGLKILNGAAAGTASDGSIVITSYVVSAVTYYRATLTLEAAATAAIRAGTYRLDFKDATADIVLGESALKVVNPVTLTST